MINLYLRPLICPLGISILCTLFYLLPETWQDSLQYRHDAILQGQLWRLFSGHLTHLNGPHLLMNLAGLWLIWLLFLVRSPSMRLCLYQLPLILLCTSLGLLLFSPELAWYRGLSGALHGLLVLALLQQWHLRPYSGILLLALFVVKIVWEQVGGPVPGSEAWISGRVIVDSHLYGAISGGIIWLLTTITRWAMPADGGSHENRA